MTQITVSLRKFGRHVLGQKPIHLRSSRPRRGRYRLETTARAR